jgi:hypothetical protein
MMRLCSRHLPPNRKEYLGLGPLSEPTLKLLDKRIPFGHNFVLNLEDFLALAALLLFETADFFLNLLLFVQGRGLAGLAVQNLKLFLGIGQRLFSGKHHVVGPAFQLFPGFLEVTAIGFQGSADGRLGVPFRFGIQAFLDLRRYGPRANLFGGTEK